MGNFSGSKLIPLKRGSTKALEGAMQIKPCRSLPEAEHHIFQELSWRKHQWQFGFWLDGSPAASLYQQVTSPCTISEIMCRSTILRGSTGRVEMLSTSWQKESTRNLSLNTLMGLIATLCIWTNNTNHHIKQPQLMLCWWAGPRCLYLQCPAWPPLYRVRCSVWTGPNNSGHSCSPNPWWGQFPLAAQDQSSSTQHQWPAFLLLACPLQNTAAKWAETHCWLVFYSQNLLHFASFFWSRQEILFRRERCFSTLVASELLKEVQWQGTDKDMTALLVLTLHRAGSCSHTSGAQGSSQACWDKPAWLSFPSSRRHQRELDCF